MPVFGTNGHRGRFAKWRYQASMRRRAFLGGLGGLASLPLAVRAQQPATPVIGYLRSQSFDAARR
jgi:hypothetical protein